MNVNSNFLQFAFLENQINMNNMRFLNFFLRHIILFNLMLLLKLCEKKPPAPCRAVRGHESRSRLPICYEMGTREP